MKTSAWIALLWASVIVFSSAKPVHLECGSDTDYIHNLNWIFAIEKGVPVALVAEHELIKEVWNLELPAAETQTVYFQNDGSLNVIHNCQSGAASARTEQWRVESVNNQPFLFWIGANGKVNRFRMDHSCEGLDLTSIENGNILKLKRLPAERAARISKVKACMVGEWTSVTLFDANADCPAGIDAYMRYEFSTNGTYSCVYGNHEGEQMENGAWEISRDAQFLILKAGNATFNTAAPETRVIRIAGIDEHGMILDQVVKAHELTDFFCSSPDQLAFIK